MTSWKFLTNQLFVVVNSTAQPLDMYGLWLFQWIQVILLNFIDKYILKALKMKNIHLKTKQPYNCDKYIFNNCT